MKTYNNFYSELKTANDALPKSEKQSAKELKAKASELYQAYKAEQEKEAENGTSKETSTGKTPPIQTPAPIKAVSADKMEAFVNSVDARIKEAFQPNMNHVESTCQGFPEIVKAGFKIEIAEKVGMNCDVFVQVGTEENGYRIPAVGTYRIMYNPNHVAPAYETANKKG